MTTLTYLQVHMFHKLTEEKTAESYAQYSQQEQTE